LVDNESVFFAEPGSVASFAAAMDRALSNPILAKNVGLNGRKVAEKEFNKDVQAKILYDFLIQLQQDS
jgi:glycosyltransferase involved in cell wall biosynthesis